MSKTGTSCSTAGPNQATCSLNTLAAGTSETLNVLVDTTGVVTGTTITGNASVTSTGGAPSQQASLTGLNVVVVPQGVTTVAVPSQPVSSTSKPLSKKLGAKVTLKLPAKVPKMGPFMTWDRDAMPFGATESGPPVSVTLEALAGPQDPVLCPPASGGCDGEIVEIEGNFSAYTSSATPISAVVEIYYGKTVPAGKVYFQAATNDTPKVLPACKKTAGSYNTPCLSAATVTGATGKKSAEDTVLFTGGDPLVGRR
jgi:hypothetical protein